MQASRPINGDVAQAVVQLHCTIQGRPRVQAAEVKEAIKDRAVVPHVELIILLLEVVGGRLLVLQVDTCKVLNVRCVVEGEQLCGFHSPWPLQSQIDLKLLLPLKRRWQF